MPAFRWNGASYIDLRTGATFNPAGVAWDFSDSKLPWAYTDSSAWTSRLPSGLATTAISTGSSDFYTNLMSTLNAAPGRTVVILPPGVFTVDQFRVLGSSGNPTYAFGFYHPKLAGFIGAGPDQTFIEMAPNSVSTEQLDYMKTMTQASFSPLQMGLCRIDTQYNSVAAPVYLGGLTFRAAPQNQLTAISADITNAVYVPQSAPHQGVVIYSDSNRRHSDSVLSHVRFQGAGKAMTSQPPFEMANITSQRNQLRYYNCEFDGRMSPVYDATQPRKCGPIMFNGGVDQQLFDSWLHHSNVSRYAANDETVVSGTALSNHYALTRCKLEQITNNQNKQPPLNGGNSLGGYTNASGLGWESSNALIELTDVIVSQDNNLAVGQVPTHLQFTNTGAARVGGRVYVVGGDYRNTGWSQLNGYVTFRIQQTSNWWTDGFDTTIDVRKTAGGTRLIAHNYTGTWPPTQGYLDGNSLSPSTHYIVRAA